LLRRLLGDAIELAVHHDDVPIPVLCDRGQIEQVILNLCVNARDAIAESGAITIEVATDGRQASLVVADSGHGITPEVRDHIFEPFFTTKDVGKGTGLGLATVYGIVEQHGGSIDVESEPGRGSRFRILLPLSDQQSTSDQPDDPAAMPRGDETILVAEDEDSLRDLMARVLRNAGYRVLTASDGEDAVALHGQHPEIDLVVMDVVMPRLGGRSAAREMQRRRPDLPVVFVTGHPGRPGADDEQLLDGDDVLMKPFSSSALLGRVRDALDA
jgi:CheY-like chemotaxis protein